MSNVVIKVENVSKQYRLGKVGTGTLRHDLNRWWHTIRGKEDPYLKIGEINDRTKKGDSEYVWALKDINFEVKRGEVLGIIGRNGAGKSTLLKILSRTTTPTTGEIKTRGRIASLLEVGTGFHPELTGRENIFLNGAILGMRKAEIQRKLDEIIDFSGVERYIDTPVKRYSSGMYVRLAFAVAAHLESEILIVDEVLAVGDAEFQKKCLGKMGEVSRKQGRTVLFVSHNMAAVSNLCSTSILLNKGNLFLRGETQQILQTYLSDSVKLSGLPISKRLDRVGAGNLRFSNVEILNNVENKLNGIISGGILEIILTFESDIEIHFANCRVSVLISGNDLGLILLSSELVFYHNIELKDKSEIVFRIDKLPLSMGLYYFTLFVESNSVIEDWIENAFRLEVMDGDFYGYGKNYPSGWSGKTVLIPHEFYIKN